MPSTPWDKLIGSPAHKKFAPEIDAAAKTVSKSTGVPEELLRSAVTALAAKESEFNPSAVGKIPLKDGTRAKGIMQYIPTTAKAVGIDPMNAGQSILAATRDAAAAFKRGGVAEIAASHVAGGGGGNRGPNTRAYVRDFLDGISKMGTPAHQYAPSRLGLQAGGDSSTASLEPPGDPNPFAAGVAAAAPAAPPSADMGELPMPGDTAPAAAPMAMLDKYASSDTPIAPKLVGLDTNPFGGHDVRRDPTTLRWFESMIEDA